jgi:RHS repeat-associated protein
MVNWLVSDHLGTPRMVADETGSLVGIKRHDYLPFGEEMTWQGGRDSGHGYSTDSVKQKYTGYERDTETNLNFAEARYHSDQQGRFTSIDPLAASAKLTDPQTLNRYAYVGNKPTLYTDPTGMSAHVGSYSIHNYSGGMAAESHADGLSSWPDMPQTISIPTVTFQVLGHVNILGNDVLVYVATGQTQEYCDTVMANVNGAASVINANAGKLSDEDKQIIGNITQIAATGTSVKWGDIFHAEGVKGIDPAARTNVGVVLQNGTFFYDALGKTAPSAFQFDYFASTIAHEGFHVQDFKTHSGEFAPEAKNLVGREGNDLTERRGLTYQLNLYRRFHGTVYKRSDVFNVDKFLQGMIAHPHCRPGIQCQ